MNRARELVHDTVRLLRRHGFVPVVSNGGKHLRVRWFDNQGRRYTLIIPASPSDRRTRLNSRAVLRRLLRGNGAKRRQPNA
jgi:hypothetical protein